MRVKLFAGDRLALWIIASFGNLGGTKLVDSWIGDDLLRGIGLVSRKEPNPNRVYLYNCYSQNV